MDFNGHWGPKSIPKSAESLHLEGGQITRTSDVEDVAAIHQRIPGGLTGVDAPL